MNLMRYKWLYFLISAIVIVPGLISLCFFGLKPAIDFTGGSLLEVKVNEIGVYEQIDPLLLAEELANDYPALTVQKSVDQQLLYQLVWTFFAYFI